MEKVGEIVESEEKVNGLLLFSGYGSGDKWYA